MQRFKIVHNTFYNFSGPVTLDPHELRLRPREDHELRIETSTLKISPPAALLWRRDVEGNSVALATFASPAAQLRIESVVVLQQFNEAPLNFLVAPEAVQFPFAYAPDDAMVLAPYRVSVDPQNGGALAGWLSNVYAPGEPIQTYGLLERLAARIHESFRYQSREEPGVQSPDQTLELGSGSCRDFAALFMEAARSLGLAARFVSGYLHAPPSPTDFGATHAWAEVYLPGAGWKGFDPTIGRIVGADHFAVAVARSPDAVPPVAGSFTGPPGSSMNVGVWVTRC
jgi:transglutaminase-like putative cysteine protease